MTSTFDPQLLRMPLPTCEEEADKKKFIALASKYSRIIFEKVLGCHLHIHPNRDLVISTSCSKPGLLINLPKDVLIPSREKDEFVRGRCFIPYLSLPPVEKKLHKCQGKEGIFIGEFLQLIQAETVRLGLQLLDICVKKGIVLHRLPELFPAIDSSITKFRVGYSYPHVRAKAVDCFVSIDHIAIPGVWPEDLGYVDMDHLRTSGKVRWRTVCMSCGMLHQDYTSKKEALPVLGRACESAHKCPGVYGLQYLSKPKEGRWVWYGKWKSIAASAQNKN